MARDRISASTKDLINDGGSILLSLVLGEQKELPVVLDMVSSADDSYTYEAVIIEGENDGEGTKPSAVESGGVEDTLTTRLCNFVGDWSAVTGYDAEDVVDYTDGYSYRLLSGTARVDSTLPPNDPLWVQHDKRTMYIQFTSALGTTYTQAPLPDVPVYGFFELRVTEVSNPTFVNTWKPVRGLVEFLFSPTDLI